jgi:hypothetical protein
MGKANKEANHPSWHLSRWSEQYRPAPIPTTSVQQYTQPPSPANTTGPVGRETVKIQSFKLFNQVRVHRYLSDTDTTLLNSLRPLPAMLQSQECDVIHTNAFTNMYKQACGTTL